MRYFPHVLSFTFFLFLGLAIGGVFSFVWFVRAVGAAICMAICLLIVEAAVTKRAVKPAEEKRYVTAIAQSLLRKGDICTVDTRNRTIERAVS